MSDPDVKSDPDKVLVIEDEDDPDAGFVVLCSVPIFVHVTLSGDFCHK